MNDMKFRNSLSPRLTLFCSLILYPSALRLLTGRKPSKDKLAASIRVISTFHSSLTTLLALKLLSRLVALTPSITSTSENETLHPLIALRSNAANSLTALETGYLLSSIPSLLAEARAYGRKPSKTMLTHHAGIGTALLILQSYIWRGKERGVYVIVMFLLMNASTPLLNLRWLLKHRDYSGWTLKLVNQMFLFAFLSARVLLPPAIIKYYGYLKGLDLGDTWTQELKWQCRLGTGALWTANVTWLAASAYKII